MDPAALLDPKGARRRGNYPPFPTSALNLHPFPNTMVAQDRSFSSPTMDDYGYSPNAAAAAPHPTPQTPPHAHPHLQQFDPRALLNPKSASKRPATEQELERGRDNHGLPGGQVSLVERLHNVHERTSSPAKRPKTETDQRKQKGQAQPSFGSGALDLTNQNSQHVTPNPNSSDAIDLTMSDDEDVQFVKQVETNENQLICVGKVAQIYVQAHCVPCPDPQKYQGNYAQQSRMKVKFRRANSDKHTAVVPVTDPTDREFGRMDFKSAKAIAPLMDNAKNLGLKWMAWTDPRRKQPGEGPPGSPLSTLIAVTFQFYCPRRSAATVGAHLQKYKVFLHDPVFELQRWDYYNPQTHASFTRETTAQAAFEQPRHAAGGGYGGTYVLRSVEEIRSDVHNMFNTIGDVEQMQTREPSSRVQTPLYKHQKQALFFMWDKEQEWQGKEADERKDALWQLKYRDNGAPYYLHVITGQESSVRPPSCRGGILADEMGLGKTLSILSLVADDESMAAAMAFAQMRPKPKSTNSYVQPMVNSGATLLVCPLSTMYNWKDQLERHFPAGRGLKWTNYHGKSRSNMTPQWLADHDIVVTTYNMISADFADRKTPLAQINWFRIVLDEAHSIRNERTKQSVAACSLSSQRRWAVTGTPVQNRLEDLGALFRFLRLEPFHSTAGFNNHILSPFKNADPDIVPKLQLLVTSCTLRRIKDKVLEIELPSREDLVVKLEFSKDERRLHDWFEADSSRKVDAVARGEKMGGKAYARILTAITNLRLICAHGRDLLSEEALKLTDGMTYDQPMEIDDDDNTESLTINRKRAYDFLDLLIQTGREDNACAVIGCTSKIGGEFDDEDDEEETKHDYIGSMASCYCIVCAKHSPAFRNALQERTAHNGLADCPFCSSRIAPAAYELKRSDFAAYREEQERLKRDPKLAKKVGAYIGPHTKTKALLADLEEHRQWSQANPSEAPIKSVVFSTWTTHLDLIEIALTNERHKYVRLDGRMPREARNRSLEAFDKDHSVTIILVSIGAGGLGLNLTRGNKAFVMEPQFNPAAEAQAVDRVHRLGQKRPVTIKRFIMENSFEEKMLELQRKKKALADLTMAREKSSKEQQAKQRLEDLRSLFK